MRPFSKGPRAADPSQRRPLLDEPDHVTFGVGEQGELDVDLGSGVHPLRAHHSRSTEALRLRQRGFYVRDLDVEGDVAVIAFGPRPDTAADPDPFGVRVPFPRTTA